MQLKTYRPFLTAPLIALLGACGTSEPAELGSVHVKSALVDAAAGGTLEVTAADDYAPFIGTKIVVPAGALARDTKITIDVSSDSLMDEDAEAAGPSIELGPSGTQFSTPAEVTVPITEDVDEDTVRIYVRHSDGTREVILPTEITIDAEANLLRFSVSHFTTYHPGRARGACRHLNCPAGSTCRRGRCITPNPCTAQDCGPAPGAPNYTCPDGTIAGPVCERSAAGVCGWNFVSCPGACAVDSDCAAGEQCVSGTCQVGSTSCGGTPAGGGITCGAGQYCCNPSCGICAPVGSACTQQVCGSACQDSRDCAASEQCVNGQCVAGERCGSNVCAAGEVCCNESCGICTPPGGACTEQACGCADDSACASNEVCDNGQCVPAGGTQCGNNTCARGTTCCNASCGICTPPGVACTQQACMACSSDADCASPANPRGRCVNGYCQ